jgi:hypothetical protein
MNFNIGLAIMYKYPNADPFKDVVVLHNNGVWTLSKWNLTDPQPDESTLAQWYCDAAKSEKIKELQQARDNECLSTFTSSALGTPHTYKADVNARTRYDTVLARMLRDSTYTSENIYTVEEGYVAHNLAQMTQLFDDGIAHEKQMFDKYQQLLNQVNAITSTDPATVDQQLAAIVW